MKSNLLLKGNSLGPMAKNEATYWLLLWKHATLKMHKKSPLPS